MISGRTYGLTNKQLHVRTVRYISINKLQPTGEQKTAIKKVRYMHVRLGWCITSDILLYNASDTIHHPIATSRAFPAELGIIPRMF